MGSFDDNEELREENTLSSLAVAENGELVLGGEAGTSNMS